MTSGLLSEVQIYRNVGPYFFYFRSYITGGLSPGVLKHRFHCTYLSDFFSHKIPGYFEVKMAILKVLVKTILPAKGRRQRHSKIPGAQNLKNSLNIILKCTGIS